MIKCNRQDAICVLGTAGLADLSSCLRTSLVLVLLPTAQVAGALLLFAHGSSVPQILGLVYSGMFLFMVVLANDKILAHYPILSSVYFFWF